MSLCCWGAAAQPGHAIQLPSGSAGPRAEAAAAQSSMRQDLADIPALAKLPPQALAALEAAQFRADVNNKKVDVRAQPSRPFMLLRSNGPQRLPAVHRKPSIAGRWHALHAG